MKRTMKTLLLAAVPLLGVAAPVSTNDAALAARGWALSGRRGGLTLGTDVRGVRRYESGDAAYHVVRLDGGTVITSADTDAEPIVAFTSATEYEEDSRNPLTALLKRDAEVRALIAETERSDGVDRSSSGGMLLAGVRPLTAKTSAAARWQALVEQGSAEANQKDMASADPRTAISDVRVAPLLTTAWDQLTHNNDHPLLTGKNCYNYYTPSLRMYDEDSESGRIIPYKTSYNLNGWCGCTATAMAQIMRYWEYPSGKVAQKSFECYVVNCSDSGQLTTDAITQTLKGGPYSWDLMSDSPATETLAEQNYRAIGTLTHDCAVALGTEFSYAYGGSASPSDVHLRMTGLFGYKSANWYFDMEKLGSTETWHRRMIYAPLDANTPVHLSIKGPGGHSIVGDGYGYETVSGKKTPFVHLNMGWSGAANVWYNLPNIDTEAVGANQGLYSIFKGITYNIFPSESGQVVSGRALNAAGAVIANATVSIRASGSQTVLKTAKTNARGIYAFVIPGGQAYQVSAESGTLAGTVTTEVVPVSSDTTVGNSWGNEIVLREKSKTVSATPQALVAEAAADGRSVRLAWNYGTAGATFYIYRATGSSRPSQYAYTTKSSSSGAVTYDDTSVTQGTTYSYWVSALQSGSDYLESEAAGPVSAKPEKPVTKANLCFDPGSVTPAVYLTDAVRSKTVVSSFESGAQLARNIAWRNAGGTATGAYAIREEVLFASSRAAACTPVVTQKDPLAARTSQSSSSLVPQLSGLSAGAYVYRVTLDSTGAVDEADETDNVAEFAFTVTSAAIVQHGNDDFAKAGVLTGSAGKVEGTTVGATLENGEDNTFLNSTTTVWWTWTAPESGILTLETDGSAVDTVMDVYTGSTLPSSWVWRLAYATSRGKAAVELAVTKGSRYNIRVAGYRSAEGKVIVSWNLVAGTPRLSAPNSVAATWIDANAAVYLSWKHGTDSCRYQIYRSTSPAAVGTLVGTSGMKTYIDETATFGTTYYYWVVATKDGYETSARGGPATVTTGTERVLYVDAAKGSDSASGQSWATAFRTIGAALSAAQPRNRIQVAAGTYASIRRSDFAEPQDPSAVIPSVSYKTGITITSAAGPEKTIIDGGGSASCAVLSSPLGNLVTFDGKYEATLEGFTLRNGKATQGGGVYGGTVRNCILFNNTATGDGGGAYAATLVNCLVYGNTATAAGGGAFGGSLTNCTLLGNVAATVAGVACGETMALGVPSSVTCCNCIIWDNITSGSGEVRNYKVLGPYDVPLGGPTLRYCCTEPLPTGAGNIAANPRFVVGDTRYRLSSDSPCVNAGNNAYMGDATDLIGGERIQKGVVDMGAIESACGAAPVATTHVVTFDLDSHGTRDGGGELVQTVADGAAAIAPTVCAKDGYVFEGWDRAFAKVTADLKVTARYSLREYAISYENLKGAQNPAANPAKYTVESGSIVFRALPDVSGFKFAGWSPAKIAGGSTGDKTVTATWQSAPQPEHDVNAALDNGELTFATTGDAAWFVQTELAHAGGSAMRSGAIGNGQSSSLSTTVSGSGVLTFFWRTSSENGGDWLELVVDGDKVRSVSGQSAGWDRVEHAITGSGEHTVVWRYVKNDSRAEGLDAGFVDEVSWTAHRLPNLTFYEPGEWSFGPAFFMSTADSISSCSLFDSGESFSAVYGYENAGDATACGPYTNLIAIVDETWETVYSAGIEEKADLPAGGAVEKTYAAPSWKNLAPGAYKIFLLLNYGSSVEEECDWDNDAGFHFAVRDPVSLNDALDTDALTFSTSGVDAWYGTKGLGADGVDCAVSLQTGDATTNDLTATVVGPQTVSFKWKVSSEEDCDWLQVLVDGTLVSRISGETDWQDCRVEIPSGSHTLTWRYAKDAYMCDGMDCGWIDQVVAQKPTPEQPVPEWKSQIVKKSLKMSVYARIYDVASRKYLDHSDGLLAAFSSSGECRGCTSFQSDDGFDLFGLSVGIESDGEKGFSLKYWSAATGILDVTDGFDANEEKKIGTYAAPVTYRVGGLTVDISLDQGWNWVSLPVRPDDLALGSVLSGFAFADEDVIESADGLATYFNGKWCSGDFAEIVPGAGYCIQKGAAGRETVTVSGVTISDEVEIGEGWNWFGSRSVESVALADLRHSAGFADGDIVNSADGMATYSSGKWRSGDFESLEPCAGYMAKFARTGTLAFGGDRTASDRSVRAAVRVATAEVVPVIRGVGAESPTPEWKPVAKPRFLNLYCQVVKNDGSGPIVTAGSRLAAFAADGECRGVTTLIADEDVTLFAIKVNAETESEDGFSLKVWDAATGETHDIEGTFGFSDCTDGKIGSFGAPVTMTVVEEIPDPPPVFDEVRVESSVSEAGGGKVSGGMTVKRDAQGNFKPVTLKATPNKGYWFAGWYEGDEWVSGGQSFKYTPQGDREVASFEARFVPARTALCGTYDGYARVNLKGMTLVKSADTSRDVVGEYPLTATLSSAGKLSGSITVGGKKVSFTADGCEADPGEESWVVYRFNVDEKVWFGKANVESLRLEISRWTNDGAWEEYGVARLGGLSGEGDYLPLGDEQSGFAYRVADKGDTGLLAPFAGTYAIAVLLEDADASDYGGVIPLSLTIDKSGKVKATGKYADGTALAMTGSLTYRFQTTIGEDEQPGGNALVHLFAAPKALGGGSLHFCIDIAQSLLTDECSVGASCSVTRYSPEAVKSHGEFWGETCRYSPDCWIPEDADPDFGVVRLTSGEDVIDISYASKNGKITGLGKALQSGVTVKFDAKTGILVVTKGKTFTIQGLLGDYASGCYAAGRINADGTIAPVSVDFVTLPQPEENFPWTADGFVLTVGQNFCDCMQPSVVSDGSDLELAITGLPAGLRFDKKTGLVTGAPTKSGTFSVKVSYAYGTQKITRTTTFVVSAKPANLPVGTYSGSAEVSRGEGEESVIGAFTGTIDKNGALTGSVTVYGKKLSLKASGYDSFDGTFVYYDSVALDQKSVNKSWGTAYLTIEADASGMTAMTSEPFGTDRALFAHALRNQSKDADYAARVKPFVGSYVAAFETSVGESIGITTLSVSVDKKGAAKLAGTLVDGSAFSASATLAVMEGEDGVRAKFLAPVSVKTLKEGGLCFSLVFVPVENETGGTTVSLDCTAWCARYVFSTGEYVAYDLTTFGNPYGYTSLAWVDESVDPDATCLEVTCDNGAFDAARFAWTTKSVAGEKVITGVGKTVNKSKVTFRLDDKTGLFSGTFGTSKIFGAMQEGSCSGVGTIVGKDGSIGRVSVAVVEK